MKLNVETREKLGKGVQALRKKGQIPAELYGRGLENMHLLVDAREFKKLYKEAGENTILSLMVGGKEHKALIHDVQRDAVEGNVHHIDFHEVRMDEVIHARVPIELVGEAPAIKEQGGILNRTMTEIEVEALPSDLPHSLEVDITNLKELNQSVYVKDLTLPKGVKIDVDPETVIVSIAAPMKEEVAPVAPVDVADVKVETEEKKAERETEKASDEAK
jgi:large subunit ribosomal protein L25